MEQNRCERVKARPQSLWLLLLAGIFVWSGCGGDSDSGAEFSKGSLLPAGQDTHQIAEPDSLAMAAPSAENEQMTEMPSLEPVAASDEVVTTNTVAQTADQKMKQAAPVEAASPSASGDYIVQIGSFRSADNARALVLRVNELGYRPEVEVASLGGQTYHRVVVKGLISHQEAERCGEHIRSQEGVTYLIRRR